MKSLFALLTIAGSGLLLLRKVRKDNKMKYDGSLFDCVNCGLPAEIKSIIILQIGNTVNYQYLVECLGPEDPYVLMEEVPIKNGQISLF